MLNFLVNFCGLLAVMASLMVLCWRSYQSHAWWDEWVLVGCALPLAVTMAVSHGWNVNATYPIQAVEWLMCLVGGAHYWLYRVVPAFQPVHVR
jgi:hypothetical protein